MPEQATHWTATIERMSKACHKWHSQLHDGGPALVAPLEQYSTATACKSHITCSYTVHVRTCVTKALCNQVDHDNNFDYDYDYQYDLPAGMTRPGVVPPVSHSDVVVLKPLADAPTIM